MFSIPMISCWPISIWRWSTIEALEQLADIEELKEIVSNHVMLPIPKLQQILEDWDRIMFDMQFNKVIPTELPAAVLQWQQRAQTKCV